MALICSINIIGLFLCAKKNKNTLELICLKKNPYMIIWPYIMLKTPACLNCANIWQQLTETLFTLGYTRIKTSLKEMTKAA